MSFSVIDDPLPDGFFAIEASAGTGKTWTLSHLVARLLLTQPALRLDEVLVITFTNAAADELAARIREVLADCRRAATGLPATAAARTLVERAAVAQGASAVQARLDACLSGLDELGVGTIHACCRRLLDRAAFASGESFAADLLSDDGEAVAAAVRDAWRARVWPDPRLAALAQAWSPDADAQVWRRWHRHPGTVVEPALDLDAVLDTVGTAAAAVRAAATPVALASLPGLDWRSGADPEPARAWLAAGGDPLDGFHLVAALGQPAAEVVKLAGLAEAEAHPLLAACRALVAAAAEARIAWLGWLCPTVAERLRATLASSGQWTQDDLLRRTRAALAARPDLAVDLRRRWPVVLIDEFQDTDPVQWDIFRATHGEGGRLVVVGDPKQAIYRFRGADLDAYLGAVNGAARASLLTNHRSDPRLVAAVQALLGRSVLPFLVPGIALPPVAGRADWDGGRLDDDDAPLTLLLPPEQGKPPPIPQTVAAEVVRLLSDVSLGDRPVAPRDCAVLVRTSAQAAEVRAALRARGVPATMAADGDVLDSPAATELRAVLTALARPRDGHALRLALATRAWGEAAAQIAARLADDASWQELADEVDGYHRLWQRSGLTAAIEAWAARTGALARLADLNDGERWLTDWRHAVEVLHAQATRARLRPAAVLAWWDRRGDAEAEGRRLRLDGDASAVRVLTMHGAKGLEFPIVFCPYVGLRRDRGEEGVLVADAAGARLVLGGPGLATAVRQRTEADDAEQLRLGYVALTRAQVRCYLHFGMWTGQVGVYHIPLQSPLGWWLRPAHQPHAAWRGATATGAPGRDRLLTDAVRAAVDLAAAGGEVRVRAALIGNRVWQAPVRQVGEGDLQVLPVVARAALDRPRRIASFTALIGHDGGLERRRGDEPLLPVPEADEPPQSLRALARGADVGDALHAAIEAWDFVADPEPQVRSALAALGLDVSGPRQPHLADPVAAVRDGLLALARTPIRCRGRELMLGAVPERLRRAEWEFHLPLARVRPARVMELISAHGALPADAVADLPELREAAPAGGFLKGFVDLLASDGAAWWVLDWKSNHLGDRTDDYVEARLWPAMARHGYLVQALIYLLALHRHLRVRLGSGYDYDQAVGGAAWIFLRGLDVGHGVWTWKPPLALVHALERELLEGPR